ncbi:cystathionine beta-lyase [Aneurinibacillus migulanus]|uniref:MalY/PatB family protein n=1 Tax=Aneurinibacillus migulanus TaxID=47500 RepID=UPI0005BCFC52|nr:MalY/PatB family protein [Aneurinibacillus migulanus]KIV54584.1 cystathionine beta-lyase [Aneurinibacillus migulanus]KPD08019.1 cystathionine beta-lyase [Aneurinibacillus migulanus]CEH30186.1 Aminotransferase class I and II [Aneurinibacillus migulanus]
MKYNFDEMIDRTTTDSIKWSPKHLKENFGDEKSLPMWIADMDFRAPQPVIDTLIKRAEHGIFGYGHQSEAFLDSLIAWQERRNGWTIEREWILYTPGIIPALNFIVQSFCIPGDKIIVQSPVYYPFYNIIQNNGCHVVENKLKLKELKYEMDFDQLEDLVKDSRTKLLFLCSPHNPTGRVWTHEELIKLGRICIDNDVMIVSDEIHSDLIYEGHTHIPFAKISDEFANHSIICTSPTKTFNLAGLHVSNIIVKNRKNRNILKHRLETMDIDPGSFATVAQIAAYNEGEEWLSQLLNYLQGNIELIESFVNKRLSGVKFIKPEGTYLAWLDFTELFENYKVLEQFMQSKAKLALDEGYIFGSGGEGFERINFACSRELLKDALERIEKSINLIRGTTISPSS